MELSVCERVPHRSSALAVTPDQISTSMADGVINGTKVPVADGGIADVAIVVCKSDGGDGATLARSCYEGMKSCLALQSCPGSVFHHSGSQACCASVCCQRDTGVQRRVASAAELSRQC